MVETEQVIASGTLLMQGAEARLYRCVLNGKDAIAKERFKKGYRHPDLDKRLTQRRVAAEARNLQKCRNLGVRVPQVLFVDKKKSTLFLEFIDRPMLKILLFEQFSKTGGYDEVSLQWCRKLGETVGFLHTQSIIHGDLTTSNVLVDKDDMILIDFGLSSSSSMVEEKGVDLYVLERAFGSTHPISECLFESFLAGYRVANNDAPTVLKRFEEVRMRGRKRTMVG